MFAVVAMASLVIGAASARGGGVADSDGDGIPDLAETGTGVFVDPFDTGTNPILTDSDGDGVGDGVELVLGYSPANSASTPPAGSALTGISAVGTIGAFLGGTLPSRGSASEPPALLSATGVFTDLAALTPRAGLIPIEPAAPLWSDRAVKRRWLAVPNAAGVAGQYDLPGEKITFSEDDEWDFPLGTVLVKHFALPLDEGDPNNPAKQKNLETRFLVHGDDDEYYAVTYKWRPDDSDADLVPSGDTSALTELLTISRPGGPDYVQTWTFPTRRDCFECHQKATGDVLGLNSRQLNHPITYPSSGVHANQLTTMDGLKLFDQSLSVQELPGYLRSRNISDVTASLEVRVHSYIDQNCSICHRPGSSSGHTTFDARLKTPLGGRGGLIGGRVVGPHFELDDPRLVKAGDPLNSVLHYLDSSLNPEDMMPPLARSMVHDEYMAVLRQWILHIGPPTESEQSGSVWFLSDTNEGLWETYLENEGAASDPDGLITLDGGNVHLLDIPNSNALQDVGYVGTRQSFRNYRLSFDYKLGTKTFAPRLNDHRSSGLLYHVSGSDQIWPSSIRYGLGEGDVGVSEGLAGVSFDTTLSSPGSDLYKAAGHPVAGRSAAVLPSSSPHLLADWNTCECIVTEDESIHLLNGTVNNRTRNLTVSGLPLTEGRIAFQVNGAEMLYRNIELKPLSSTGGGPAYRVLVFSKTAGLRHESIDEGITAVRTLGRRNNFWVDVSEEAFIFNDAELAQYRVVIFMNTSGSVLDGAQMAAFERYIQAGGGYVGIHSAVDTHGTGDWPWYGGLVGAFLTSHPAEQNATVDILDAKHPSTASIGASWERVDEWYNLAPNPASDPEIRILASVDESTYIGGSGAVGGVHPVTWCRDYDGGRSWVTTLGHTEASYDEPLFLIHLLGGIEWAAGASPEAPSAAVVLYDGSDSSQWEKLSDGAPVTWQEVSESLQVLPGEGDIATSQQFGDFQLHLEFRPDASGAASEQGRGHSGVFLQGRYELQILDSFGVPMADADDCASLVGVADAASNEAWPAEAWQHYDIWFQAARWNGATKVQNARVTIYWNGRLVHDRVELPDSTPGARTETPDPGPIVLEDGGSPVRFRNIWILPDASLPQPWITMGALQVDPVARLVNLSWSASVPGPYTIVAATADDLKAGIFPITLASDVMSPVSDLVIPEGDALFLRIRSDHVRPAHVP